MTENKGGGGGMRQWLDYVFLSLWGFLIFPYISSFKKKKSNWSLNDKKGALCTVTHDLLWELTTDTLGGTHSLTLLSKISPYGCFPLFHSHTRAYAQTCTPTTNMTTLYLKAILCPHGESMSLQYMTNRGQAPPRPDQDSFSPPSFSVLLCPSVCLDEFFFLFFSFF